jgi:hypothetical protein
MFIQVNLMVVSTSFVEEEFNDAITLIEVDRR